MINASDEIVIIKPRKQNPLIVLGAVILFSILTYLRFQEASLNPGKSFYWVRFGFMMVVWVLIMGSFVYRKRNPQDGILKLTPMGLFKGKTLYRWYEIEQFGITGGKAGSISALFDKKTIFWNFRESSSSRSFVKRSSRVLSGYDDGILATNYEIPAEDLVKMLNDWKVRNTGQFSDIKYCGGLSRNLTKKELILIGGGLLLSLILFLSYLSVHFEKNRTRVKTDNQQIQRMRN